MQRFAIIPGLVFFLTAILAGCGHGATTSTVSQVVMSPTSFSMNSGDVLQVMATPEDSTGASVGNVTVTFGTSNTALVNVSPAGLLCAGVWDANFIDCNGDDSSGNPVSGTATITATAGGISSSAVPVIVHVKVSSVVVDPVAGCTSTTLMQQFTAHACSTLGTPHAATGPCAPNAKEITSEAGPFIWGTVDSTVASVDTNGLVTAVNPGFTSVFASVSNVTSAPVGFRTCMPIEIRLHIQAEPNESASMTQNQTLTLETDMTDEKGFTHNSIATVVSSDFPAVATLSGLNLTATSFGGGGIIAGCTPPTCGNGFPQPFPIYSNLFPVTVSGFSPSTMVFAASSFAPPNGTISTLIPINSATSPPTVGTAITLPGGTPNSMVFAANGTIAFIGTDNGLVSFNPSGNVAALVDPSISGIVLAVSPDGTKVIVSNAAADPHGRIIETRPPNQRVWVFNSSNSTTTTFVKPGAVAAAIDNDLFRSYIVTNDGTGNIYVFSPSLSLQTINIGGTSSSVAPLASDDFVYVANSAGLEVVATCNNVQQPTANNPPTNSTAIQFVKSIPSADMLVAVDPPGVDVVTATVTSIFHANPPLPFNLSPANCQPNVSYSNQFLNFGVGAFTAHQLLVATNGGQIAVLPAANPNILVAVPGASPGVAVIPLATGATEAFTGGMTPDGVTVWVGVGGTNTVDQINLTSFKDTAQVPTSFKKSDGSAAPPDIVAIQPK